jgi:hypothetical protein
VENIFEREFLARIMEKTPFKLYKKIPILSQVHLSGKEKKNNDILSSFLK